MADPYTVEQLHVFCYRDAGFCGCGDPEAAAATLLRLLDLHPLYEHGEELRAMVPDEGVRYLLLYRLDDLDLSEHGGSVVGAWLTERGADVRAGLRREFLRDGFESLFEHRCVHGYRDEDLGHDCAAECAAADKPGVVLVARCPEHGLHGQRTTCFVCGGPVEQVPMVAAGG